MPPAPAGTRCNNRPRSLCQNSSVSRKSNSFSAYDRNSRLPCSYPNTVSNILVTAEYERHNRRVSKIRFRVEENPQRSMYDDGGEEQTAIRASETYRRLIKLGIADRLAVDWIQHDPDRAQKTVTYVEERKRAKKIRGSAGGYARTVFEGGGDIETIEVVDAKSASNGTAPQSSDSDAVAEVRARAISAVIKALTRERAPSMFVSSERTAVKCHRTRLRRERLRTCWNELTTRLGFAVRLVGRSQCNWSSVRSRRKPAIAGFFRLSRARQVSRISPICWD